MLMDIAVAFLSPILTVGFSVGICIANDLDKYWPTELYFILFTLSAGAVGQPARPVCPGGAEQPPRRLPGV